MRRRYTKPGRWLVSFPRISSLAPVFAALCCVAGMSVLCLADEDASIKNAKIVSDREIVIELTLPSTGETVGAADLSAYVNGQPAEAAILPADEKKEDRFLTYLVVSVDSSRSIGTSFLKKIKSEAKQIVRERGGREVVALYRFNDDIVLLSQFTGNKAALDSGIDSIAAHGSKTLLFNSIFDSIDRLQKEKGARKGIIVFTDGKDEGSNMSADDIISLARDAKIAVNFVTVKKSRSTESIARIAKASSGGVAYIDEEWDEQKYKMKLPDAGEDFYRIRLTGFKGADAQASIDLRVKQGTRRYRIVETVNTCPEPTAKKNTDDILRIIFIAAAALICVFLCGLCLYLNRRNKKSSAEIVSSPQIRQQLIEQPEETEAEKPARPLAWIAEKDGIEKGKKFVISGDELLLGQSEENGIVVRDVSVSPQHARIRFVKNRYMLFDLASEHGTFLNGRKLLRPKYLSDWDEITLGGFVFVFRCPDV